MLPSVTGHYLAAPGQEHNVRMPLGKSSPLSPQNPSGRLWLCAVSYLTPRGSWGLPEVQVAHHKQGIVFIASFHIDVKL